MENSMLVTDSLYDALLKKILQQEFQVGECLPSENQLCKLYSLSRGSVRSALQRLAAQNLVATRPGKGTYVISNTLGDNILSRSVGSLDLSKDEFRYVVELRKAIEFTCIDLMALYGEPQDFERLLSALAEMESCGEDAEAYVQADYHFHMAITLGSHNPLLVSVMNGCKDTMLKYFREMALGSSGTFAQARHNHRRIYQALLARDAQKVKDIIEGTFEYNTNRFSHAFKGEQHENNGD